MFYYITNATLISINSEKGEVPNKKFSYENYKKRGEKHFFVKKSYFDLKVEWTGYPKSGFYWLQYSMPQESKPVLIPFGYKFHIGVNDSEGSEDNLARAWDLIKDIMIKHDITRCKVVGPEGHFSTNDAEKQYGKQITIYATEDPRRDDIGFWQDILQEVESALIANDIAPDPNSERNTEPTIDGSQYTRYRNDARIHEDSMPHVHCLKYIYDLKRSNPENECLALFPGIVNMPIQYLPVDISWVEINKLFPNGIDGAALTEETLSPALMTLPKYEITEMNAIANQEAEVFCSSPVHNATLCDPLQSLTLLPESVVVTTPSSTSCIAAMLSCCLGAKTKDASDLRAELLDESQDNILKPDLRKKTSEQTAPECSSGKTVIEDRGVASHVKMDRF